jgi:hypothetical protein
VPTMLKEIDLVLNFQAIIKLIKNCETICQPQIMWQIIALGNHQVQQTKTMPTMLLQSLCGT